MPEYKTQSLKKSRFILSHYGVFKGFWDWLILVSTFYVAFVVPYNAAFVQSDGRVTMASDVIVEALFIVGMSLNLTIFSPFPETFLFYDPLTRRRIIAADFVSLK